MSLDCLECFNLLYQRSKGLRMSRDFIGEHQIRIEMGLQKGFESSVLYSPNSPSFIYFPNVLIIVIFELSHVISPPTNLPLAP